MVANDAPFSMDRKLSEVKSRTLPPYRDSCPHSAVRLCSVAAKSPSFIAALNTSPAWLRTRTEIMLEASRTLRDASSIISVLVRNQAGEVFKAAMKDGDLAATEHNLTAEWGHESLYGGRV